MSDEQQWQAPGGSQPPPPVVPPYAGSAAPAPAAFAPPPPGWTPPPKPGLVPLRPMTLGTILGASFQVMRRNPRTTLVPGLVVALILAISLAIGLAAFVGAISRIGTTTSGQDASALAAGSLAVGLIVLLAGGVLTTIATAILQAIIVTEVARGTVGEKLRLGQVWAAARGRFGAVIGYTALLILAVAVGFIIFYALLVGVTIAATAGSVGSSSIPDPGFFAGLMLATFGIMIIGFLGGATLWLWLSTKLAFVPAAIVLERLPVGAAIRRSWRLSRGYFWRTLGILLLVQVMVYIATQIASAPASIFAYLGASILDPTGGSLGDGAVIGVVVIIVVFLLTSVVSAIGMVIVSATSSLLYLDLRMRKEGLDLELARFVEARQTGAQVPDPYLPRA